MRERGYTILARDARLRRGASDIVALDRETIVSVEVTPPRSAAWGTPGEAITRQPQRALVRQAQADLAGRSRTDRPCRFRAEEVWMDAAGRPAHAEIIRDACRAQP